MNTKILASIVVLAIAAAATTYGTFAFFSDTEQSTGNIFTAGDLDLTLDGLNGVTATIVGTNFAPGDNTSGNIILRNEGSIFTGDAQGHLVDLDVCVSVVDVDDPGNAQDSDDGGPSPLVFSRWLNVTTFSYGGSDLRPDIGDADGDGRAPTLRDLMYTGRFGDLADPGAAGSTLALDVHFAEDGPNYLKRDAASMTLTFYLSQGAELDLDCADVGGVGTVVYESGFDTHEAPGWDAPDFKTSPSGEAFLGEFGAGALHLNLASVPAHSKLLVELDLYILHSWDGNGGSGPDRLAMTLDGVTFFDSSFAYQTLPQCYPLQYPCATTSPAGTGAMSAHSLGYVDSWASDYTYRLAFELPHTGDSIDLGFLGMTTEPEANEAWGLDNVRITAFP